MYRFLSPMLCATLVAQAPNPAPTAVARDTANPAVAPGLIAWHPTLAAAKADAQAKGRPILLFQLLGSLDRELC